MLLVFSGGHSASYGLQKFTVYFTRPQDLSLETFKQLFFIFLDCNSILVFFSLKDRLANTNFTRFSLLFFSCGLGSIFVLTLRKTQWLDYGYQGNQNNC